jgi:outer membrane protein insertion porin family
MRLPVAFLTALLAAAGARAQTPPAAPPQTPAPAAATGTAMSLPALICNLQVPAPSNLPPAGSGPYVYAILPCFEKQGGTPVVDAQTYLFYMEMRNRVSAPSENRWVPYTDDIEPALLGDFRRLWATNFLDDLSIEVRDVRFANGVIGKVVVYNMEERQRVKIVDYLGSDKVDQSKIEEELRDRGIKIALDSFIDPGTIRRVTGIVRELYAEKGYQFAEVKPEIKAVAGGPKLVHLTFNITEGPQVRIRDLEFMGNQKVSDRALSRKMKENKGKGFWLGWLTRGGTFKEDKFGEDAEKVIEHYRDKGYITAQVGQPELRVLEDDRDGKTRWIQLRVPVTEGNRYKVGNFTFEGNTIVKGEALRSLFKLQEGDTYSEKAVRKGLEKAREVYGTGGYYEFVAYPDLKPRDLPPMESDPAAGPPQPGPSAAPANGPPIVDVVMRVTEGKQYFVNRITFTGNTTTRDNVIRREIRLLEAGVFNTEALKYSIKRLNQLGYFKALEGDAIQVEKTAGADNKVDISLKLEEQNRNQLTFGAGVSQFDGFFGQLSFQTSNFLGRGETFTISAQQGNRAKNYQLAFTEPFLFDRPMTAGIDLFIREIRYIGMFTQASQGGNLVYGFQTGDFSRMFLNYSFEQVEVKDLNPLYNDLAVIGRNPFLQDSLLIGEGGKRTISKIAPSWVYNTVDQPIFPSSGTRYTLSADFAGIGGNTNFVNPRAEGIWYIPLNRRTSLGFRAAAEYIKPYGSTQYLPIYERLYLGGEYSIRGFDIRTVGPRDEVTAVVLGGNKSLLFNAEYLINIAGPVRLVLFADAGQVRDTGQRFTWQEDVIRRSVAGTLVPQSILDPYYVFNPLTQEAEVTTEKIGRASAFKTSLGAEVRFFMPVLNVPFRLIFAMNPNRYGVLDNNLQPERKYKFRFAVGTTF